VRWLDKTLHFWFLAPARREALLAGKYLAGVIAAILIYGVGAALCFGIMLLAGGRRGIGLLLARPGGFAPVLVRRFGCAGLCRIRECFSGGGPASAKLIVPAITILFWESVNDILPAMLQKLSVLYYVQSLCPVPVPMKPHATLTDPSSARPRRASLRDGRGSGTARGNGAGAVGGLDGSSAPGNKLGQFVSWASEYYREPGNGLLTRVRR